MKKLPDGKLIKSKTLGAAKTLKEAELFVMPKEYADKPEYSMAMEKIYLPKDRACPRCKADAKLFYKNLEKRSLKQSKENMKKRTGEDKGISINPVDDIKVKELMRNNVQQLANQQAFQAKQNPNAK
jgi:hypothetical protein